MSHWRILAPIQIMTPFFAGWSQAIYLLETARLRAIFKDVDYPIINRGLLTRYGTVQITVTRYTGY